MLGRSLTLGENVLMSANGLLFIIDDTYRGITPFGPLLWKHTVSASCPLMPATAVGPKALAQLIGIG